MGRKVVGAPVAGRVGGVGGWRCSTTTITVVCAQYCVDRMSEHGVGDGGIQEMGGRCVSCATPWRRGTLQIRSYIIWITRSIKVPIASFIIRWVIIISLNPKEYSKRWVQINVENGRSFFSILCHLV